MPALPCALILALSLGRWTHHGGGAGERRLKLQRVVGTSLSSWGSCFCGKGRPNACGLRGEGTLEDEVALAATGTEGGVFSGQSLQQILPGLGRSWGWGLAGDFQELPTAFKERASGAIGQQSVVSDPHETLG